MRKFRINTRREVQLKRLLRRDNISVRTIDVAAHEKREDTVYVFYEPKAEMAEIVEKEKERLQRLRLKAKEVRSNAVFQKLTNAKQRSLFLCEKCQVTKGEAEDIVELVKVINVEEWVREEEQRTEEEAAAREKMKSKRMPKDEYERLLAQKIDESKKEVEK